MTQTTSPFTERLQSNQPNGSNIPVYVRLPRSGTKEFYSSLSRSALNALILPAAANGFKPAVVSTVLKSNKYARHGVRLILLSSLLDYLSQGADPKGGQP